MKKNALLFAVVLVFAFAVAAQDSRGSSTSQYPSSGSSQSDASQQSTGSMGQSGSQAGSTTSSGQSSTDQTAGATVEGCIYREASEYFIYPTHGSEMKVSGQDVSSHVGHHVKLHGSQNAAASSSANAGGVSGAVGDTTTSPGTQSSAQGSMAGNKGQAGSASATSGNEFVVERVDMVSATCPAKIRKKIESKGGNLGTGDTGANPSSTTPPPPPPQ